MQARRLNAQRTGCSREGHSPELSESPLREPAKRPKAVNRAPS